MGMKEKWGNRLDSFCAGICQTDTNRKRKSADLKKMGAAETLCLGKLAVKIFLDEATLKARIRNQGRRNFRPGQWKIRVADAFARAV